MYFGLFIVGWKFLPVQLEDAQSLRIQHPLVQVNMLIYYMPNSL